MHSDDALKSYKAKRDFSVTPEPAEGGKTSQQALSFVIQKHWASHLHYDFRLELNGTMKSWAVPKGPSFDTKVKRMAVHVEDHPIAYSSFEGTIPAQQYGAGRVMIWDKGTWHPLGDPYRDYQTGRLKFELYGHKLHGKWALIRMKSKGETQEPWLLIKEKDEFARSSAEFSVVDELQDSVSSLPLPVPEPHLKSITSVSLTIPSPMPKKLAPTANPLAPGAIKAKLPALLAPQLATLVDRPPPDPEALSCEIKFDGYRLLARVEKDIKLFTRNGNDWTMKLAPLQKEIARLKLQTKPAYRILARYNSGSIRHNPPTLCCICSTFHSSLDMICGRFPSMPVVPFSRACWQGRFPNRCGSVRLLMLHRRACSIQRARWAWKGLSRNDAILSMCRGDRPAGSNSGAVSDRNS